MPHDAREGRRGWVQEDAEMPYSGQDDPAAEAADGADDVRGRHESRLMAIPGVVGVGVSRSRVGEPALVVYVRDASVRRHVPTSVDGVPVETRVTGEIDAR
jgi:hypothetical protein